MLYLVILCTILASFGIGYLAGRKKGKTEGMDEGILFAPLEIRRQCIEDGWCHICGHRVKTGRKLTPFAGKDTIETGCKLTSGGINGES